MSLGFNALNIEVNVKLQVYGHTKSDIKKKVEINKDV